VALRLAQDNTESGPDPGPGQIDGTPILQLKRLRD
jgi:hypothetical protein